jgi:hypothetical protein
MSKYAMITIRGRQMRVAYRPRPSAFGCRPNPSVDVEWWFADLTAQTAVQAEHQPDSCVSAPVKHRDGLITSHLREPSSMIAVTPSAAFEQRLASATDLLLHVREEARRRKRADERLFGHHSRCARDRGRRAVARSRRGDVLAIALRELFSALWWLLSWWREVIQFDHFVGKKVDAARSQ